MKTVLLAFVLLITSNLAAQAENHRRVYGLRETVGSVQISGWERGLVQSNPNLGRWHWTPMYANIQRIRTYGDPAAKQDKNKSPQTVANLPNIPAPHYVKPIHVPLPVKQITKYQSPVKQPTFVGSSDNRTSTNCDATLISKAQPTATYGGDYTRANTDTGIVAERTSVRGRLAPGWHL